MKRWIYGLALSVAAVVPAGAEFQSVDDFGRKGEKNDIGAVVKKIALHAKGLTQIRRFHHQCKTTAPGDVGANASDNFLFNAPGNAVMASGDHLCTHDGDTQLRD